MSRRGVVLTPPDLSPAHCYPSRPGVTCELCLRRRWGEPDDDRVVVIDASAIRPRDDCGMRMTPRAA